MKTTKYSFVLTIAFSILFANVSVAQCAVPQQIQRTSLPQELWNDLKVSFSHFVGTDKQSLQQLHSSVDALIETKEVYLLKLQRYSKGDSTIDWNSLSAATAKLVTDLAKPIEDLKSAANSVPNFSDDEVHKKLKRALDEKLIMICETSQQSQPLSRQQATQLADSLKTEINAMDKADDELIKLLQ